MFKNIIHLVVIIYIQFVKNIFKVSKAYKCVRGRVYIYIYIYTHKVSLQMVVKVLLNSFIDFFSVVE